MTSTPPESACTWLPSVTVSCPPAAGGLGRRPVVQHDNCQDGSLALRGLLDPEGGAILRTALEPLARRQGRDDQREREQRLGDGLVELATHALDTGQVPRQASQRAHLQVTTTLETLPGLARPDKGQAGASPAPRTAPIPHPAGVDLDCIAC